MFGGRRRRRRRRRQQLRRRRSRRHHRRNHRGNDEAIGEVLNGPGGSGANLKTQAQRDNSGTYTKKVGQGSKSSGGSQFPEPGSANHWPRQHSASPVGP